LAGRESTAAKRVSSNEYGSFAGAGEAAGAGVAAAAIPADSVKSDAEARNDFLVVIVLLPNG
jgi:hypothetical protein